MADKRTGIGAFLGITVFLGGVCMVAATFWRALGFFSSPPEVRLGIKEGQPIDPAVTASSLGQITIQIAVLVVMAMVGALLASQGVKLYGAAMSTIPEEPRKDPETEPKDKGSEPEP
ncbi:MAG: hypothetical protein KF884_12905 [Fimbriimonadaceae bacterium]|nr:hypothetical protein [Fimbriimonadaceae bacterium]QYK58439.1 MAG: hypothetical protein KF884_12905 [Fimbriimonadaceae bacterium]